MSEGHNSAGMLRSYFERWQRLEEDKKAIADDLKELFAEAKSNGFDPKPLRVAFRLERDDQDAAKRADRQEHDAMVDTYRDALRGQPSHARDAREAVPDHDPNTGELHDEDAAPSSGRPLKSLADGRSPEPARGAEEPAGDPAGALRVGTSPSREGDDPDPKGGMTEGSRSEHESAAVPREGVRQEPSPEIPASGGGSESNAAPARSDDDLNLPMHLRRADKGAVSAMGEG